MSNKLSVRLAAAGLGVRWVLALPLLAMNPPAADVEGPEFFLKAAQVRIAPAGMAEACATTVERAARFLFRDTGKERTIRDENGRLWPPYIYHAVIDDGDQFRYRISYPAFHHAYLVEAFLNYYNYSGDEEGLRRAREVADWTIAHSTPADYKWPGLPWSTFTEGKPGGFMDKDTLQPDKTGYMGLAYIRLFDATGEKTYFDAAKAIADTLVERQAKNGSWPFRVNPQTGDVFEQYTAGLMIPVAFLEKMHRVTGNLDYKNAQVAAWMWMLRNPLRTDNWSGFYEDIKKEDGSQVYYAPAQTIRLLLRYRSLPNEDSYMAHARRLFNWVMDGLAFADRDMGLLLREQTSYLAATPSSTLSWIQMAAEFFLATGEEKYRVTVLEGMRSVTRYGLKPDGRTHNTMLGPRVYGDKSSWYSLTSPVVRYIIQSMGCLPELAPKDQTHLLRSSTEIQQIRYGRTEVTYRTLKDSIELLKAAGPPKSVRGGGKPLPLSPGLKRDGWIYTPRSQVLLIRHAAPEVAIVW
ncbi:MAG: glycoside hydrolase family 47 protein [Bryobacteraceae bacterium]